MSSVNIDVIRSLPTDESGFPGVLLKCDGLVHKDCSFSFCMSHQGIININKSSSIFSFRKRSKFAKMAEHFEYNHIPAQMSSINHFHVKSVICYCDSLVILHLSRNANSQFGLLDLNINKFLGIFGKQSVEYPSEALVGQLSPDRTKCLIRLPKYGPRCQDPAVPMNGSAIHLYDLATKLLLKEICFAYEVYHFCFDPRFTWNRVAIAWNRVAITDRLRRQDNSLAIVNVDSWQAIAVNPQACETRRSLYPYLKDLCYTRDGCFIIASVLDTNCFCREKKLRNHHPINCSIHVYSGDTSETLHCISFARYICTQHNCPVNYKPVISICSSRIAFARDIPSGPDVLQIVQVYKLPSTLNLQNKCRVVILQNFPFGSIESLPLPQKLINYLLFKPEFN